MPMELQYRIIFQAVTPRRHALRQANDLWVVEVTDDFTLSQNKARRRPEGPDTPQVAPQKGSFEDFELLSRVNFSVSTAQALPEVVVTLEAP